MSDYLLKDEISNIVLAFKELDLKPCVHTPEDFKTWMEDYKDTDDDLWNAYLPRISAFSGDAKTDEEYCPLQERYHHSFHSFLKATREIENQHNLKPSLKKKPLIYATSKSTTTTVENKQIQQLTALVKQLSQDVKALKEDRNCDQPSTNIQWSRRDTSWTPYHPDETTIYRPVEQHKRRKQNDFTCWRCRQPGHYATECTVRLDHSRKTQRALNLQQSFITKQSTQITEKKSSASGLLESLSHQPDALDNIPGMLKEHQINIRDEQMNDSTIRYLKDKVSKKMKPRKHDVPSSPFHSMLYSNFDKLKIKRVRKENNHRRKRTLHMNHLHPIGSINEELVEENTTHQMPFPLPRRSKRKPASPKKKPAPVEVSTNSNTESEDESMVYVVVEGPQQDVQQDIQPDDIIQTDDKTASVEEEATVPGNADDDQDRTKEQSELEEDASLPEESGGSEHETSLEDQVHDLATDDSPDVTDDDSTEDENIDDEEEKDD
ncbi:unnamed protein product [Mytilus coruscus]|uniref:CCHC-type domain-containing protein n=1 Tax=Mytilus coruscus TaxID=42192 RepID=A0A6J8CYI0_MYTCO|nr:unnamed protein product [Mytilus coruscus]